ncbi:MAG: iron ABC transporter substrate-binding protein [Oligoflexia bacterium]|nr:iron ABC transporter substrate-binding protein [Oligoflexia bacterium]
MKKIKILILSTYLIIINFIMLTTQLVQTINASESELNIQDMVGRNIKINTNSGLPKRIICLSPGTLRLITYLQANNTVVGVEGLEKKSSKGRPYWIADNFMKDLPVVAPGGPSSINNIPDPEKILNTKPDLIFISNMDKNNADQFQKRIGIPIVVLSYGRFASFDEVIFKSLELAGKILNKNQRAQEVIKFIKGHEEVLKQRTKNIKELPSAYIGGLGLKGGHGIESSDASYIPFEWLNVNNVAKQIKPEGHLFVNKEKLLVLNPKYIFIDGGGMDVFTSDYKRKKVFYQQLDAFKNKRVFTLFPFNWYTTNVDSMIIDAYAIGKILYPDRFKDININEVAKDVYQSLVGKDVFNEMEKDYGKILNTIF